MTDQTEQGTPGVAGHDTENPLTHLHRFIVDGFDLEELRTLCFDLGVRYDDLRGETLSGRTRELILLLGRQRQLEGLLLQVARARADLSGQAILSTDPAALDSLYAALPSLGDAPPAQPEKPHLPFEPETVLIPAGLFLMGSLPGAAVPAHETPQHPVALRAYGIGKYPVTNGQYAVFVKQARHPAPRKAGWFGQRPPRDEPEHPVVGVTWCDAPPIVAGSAQRRTKRTVCRRKPSWRRRPAAPILGCPAIPRERTHRRGHPPWLGLRG